MKKHFQAAAAYFRSGGSKVWEPPAIVAAVLLGTTALTTPFVSAIWGAIFAAVAGAALLLKTTDVAVDHISAIGRKTRLSPAMLGVSLGAVGALGELCVAMGAIATGNPAMALGNIIGSNIANILLVLGGVAAIKTVSARADACWKFNLAVLGTGTILFGSQMLIGTLSPVIGMVLLAGLGVYLYQSYRAEKKKPPAPPREKKSAEDHLPLTGNAVMSVAGLMGLAGSAALLIAGASGLGLAMGMSPVVVGALGLAIGTSLEEIAFNFRAAMKGHTELALGNIFSSSIFNVLMIGGLLSWTGAVIPADLRPSETALGLVNMAVLCGATLGLGGLMMANKGEVGRKSGILGLMLYVAFTVASIQTASSPTNVVTPPAIVRENCVGVLSLCAP